MLRLELARRFELARLELCSGDRHHAGRRMSSPAWSDMRAVCVPATIGVHA